MGFVNNLLIISVIIIAVIIILSYIFTSTNIIFDDIMYAKTDSSTTTTVSVHVNNTDDSITMDDSTFTLSTYKSNLGNTSKVISYEKVPTLEGIAYNFMFSVWFLIEQFQAQSGSLQHIASIISTQDNSKFTCTLDIFLLQETNTLGIGINTTDSGGSGEIYNFYYIDNIPLQKWNCLIVSVNSRTLDLYLDGKLVNSFILEGAYYPYKFQSVYLGDTTGFVGYISRVRYQIESVDPEAAYSIYKEGISSNSLDNFLNKYKLKLTFYETTKEDTPIFEVNN